jgi:hypothetical protein
MDAEVFLSTAAIFLAVRGKQMSPSARDTQLSSSKKTQVIWYPLSTQPLSSFTTQVVSLLLLHCQRT